MNKNLSQKIYQFWQEQAKSYKITSDASWGDLLMQKEIEVIDTYLKDGDKVLDVGCANGYSSIAFAKRKRIKLLGIDYSRSMIKQANDAKAKLSSKIGKRITFRFGDVLNLTDQRNTFDKINSTRCLCNLTSWKDQKTAIKQLWHMLKPGGILLLSEPTIQGLKNLNELSIKFGLKPLSQPWHNLYIDEDKLKRFTKPYFKLKINYFSSTYYLFSRVIYRCLMGDNVNKLKRNSIINKIGLRLPSFGKWGVQRLYVLKKRS